MLGRLGRWVWIATTPLALTLLLATAGRAQEDVAEEAGEHAAVRGTEGTDHADGNPIKNWTQFLGYASRDEHGGPLEPGDQKMPPPFAGALFNFAVLLFILLKYAGPSAGRFVRERHESLAKALAEGKRLREEARARLDEYGRRVASLDAEIEVLTTNIRAEAEAEKRRIVAEAEARAERMQRDAQQQIAAEIQRVSQALEREAVTAAVAIAESVLREKTTDADQKILADKFVGVLKEAAAGAKVRREETTT